MSGSPGRASSSPGKSPAKNGSPKGQMYTGFNDVKSSVGGQVDSRKVTAPTTVFGSSTRPQTSSGSKSPGPGAYQIPSSIGKPILSTMNAAPACSISGREKFGSTSDMKTAANSPGPGDYTSTIVNPRERSAPKYSLGKKWTQLSGMKKFPGPGEYEAPTTIGRTVLSTQKQNPMPAFPRVERKPLAATSTADVGPGQYGVVVAAVGKQPLSTLTSAAAFSFGNEQRSKLAKTGVEVPGPASYQPKSSVGKQVESTYRTAPKISMSGRTKFGSHF
ncbi:hypothetical protein Poli38472_011944 [Pythium oligandrum]|uniref:Uncharacterized protein n=1 Tax=Pythium oligandrum TaxID=41045 RepID=A0A8K1CPW0_PYTOL|nr:hypothetical protein Poli38472_011944 [Pythium oligandrum]|eukprot:TMW66828.1 hypothetical protein Poli38472_011944 [Pythium oligandrum]